MKFRPGSSEVMDWIWDSSYSEQAIEQGSDHVGNEWECDFDFRFKPDVIEEDALNDKCCVQVLKLLLTKADSETVELQEELIMLQSQLAWMDEDWSKLCSSILQEKIDCLEILIHALKTNETQDHELGDDDLPIYREPAEKIHDILQALLGHRFQQTDSQLVGFVANHFNLDLSGAETSPINLYSSIGKKKEAKDPSLTPEVKFEAQKSSLETQVEEKSNLETVIFQNEDTSLKSKPVASKESITDANGNLEKGKQLIADLHTTGTLEQGIVPFTTKEELQFSQDQPKIESLEKQCHTDKLGSNSFSEGSKRSGNSEMSVKYIRSSVSANVKIGKKKATGDHVTSNVNLKLVYKKRKRSPVLEGTKKSKCDEISVPELSDGARKVHPVYPVFEGTTELKGAKTKSVKNDANWVDITTRTDVQIMECLNGSYVENLKSLSCSTDPHSIPSISELKKKKLKELHKIAKDYSIKGFSKLKKEELAKLVYSYMRGEKKAKGKRQYSSQ